MRLGVRVFQGAAAFALLLASAVSIDAAPFTAHFEYLLTAMRERRDAIPDDSTLSRLAERARMDRALALLARDSRTLRTDVRNAARVGRVIAPDIEATEEISTAMDTAVLGLAGEVEALRDALAARLALVVDARVTDHVNTTLADVDALLVQARSGATPVVERAAGLADALREIARENAFLDRREMLRGAPRSRLGRGRLVALADEEPFEPPDGGGHVTVDEAGAVTTLSVIGHGRRPSDPALEISWSTGAFAGTGTYQLNVETGVSAFLSSGTLRHYSWSGLVTVTEFDPVARRIAGTFDSLILRTEDGTGEIRFERGSFRVAGYAVTR